RQSVQTHTGHSGAVWSALYAPDGATVITGSEDGTVRLWPPGSPTSDPPYRGHEGQVYAVACSPRGNWIASAGRDREVHVWPANMVLKIDYDRIKTDVDLERQAFHSPKYRLRGHTGEVRALAFSADGTRLVSGGNDNTVKLWNFAAEPT